MRVTSSAFAEGQMIPARFTGMGEDLSPPLAWSGVPEGTSSLAILCTDPDAARGVWVHWVLWNLPPETRALPEGVPTTAVLTSGARQGVNDSRTTGYSGPYPPRGTPHRYIFTVYALDSLLALEGEVTAAHVSEAMQGHVLASGQLMGRFQR